GADPGQGAGAGSGGIGDGRNGVRIDLRAGGGGAAVNAAIGLPPSDAAPRTRASERVLRASAREKSYGKRQVLKSVSVEVHPGEVVGLLGPNGAGKTTTFYCVVGLARPDTGRVLLGDLDLTREPMFRRARHGISYLPQEPSVFRGLTVAEN